MVTETRTVVVFGAAGIVRKVGRGNSVEWWKYSSFWSVWLAHECIELCTLLTFVHFKVCWLYLNKVLLALKQKKRMGSGNTREALLASLHFQESPAALCCGFLLMQADRCRVCHTLGWEGRLLPHPPAHFCCLQVGGGSTKSVAFAVTLASAIVLVSAAN